MPAMCIYMCSVSCTRERILVQKYPPRAPFFGTAYAGDAAMADDHGKISRETLARANEISEVAIFWGLVLTVVVVVIAMIKGMIG